MVDTRLNRSPTDYIPAVEYLSFLRGADMLRACLKTVRGLDIPNTAWRLIGVMQTVEICVRTSSQFA